MPERSETQAACPHLPTERQIKKIKLNRNASVAQLDRAIAS